MAACSRRFRAEYTTEEDGSRGLDAGTLALARPRDVEHADAMARNPAKHRHRVRIVVEVDDEVRLTEALRERARERGAAGEGAARDNQRRVGVTDIRLGARRVARGAVLAERVARRHDAVLRAPSAWAPAAVCDAGADRGVERTAIHARLPAADHAHESHGSVVPALARA